MIFHKNIHQLYFYYNQKSFLFIFKVSVVEEAVSDRREGERIVKINLNPSMSDVEPDAFICTSKRVEPNHSKSVLKTSNSSESSIQILAEKTRNVGFKLDKECQTDSSHEQQSNYTSAITQTSTDDEDDITSRCSCFDEPPSACSRAQSQKSTANGCHQNEHFQYIDSHHDDTHNGSNDGEYLRGFVWRNLDTYY